MNSPKLFDSNFKDRGRFTHSQFTTDVIKNEEMFFNSSVEFALRFGGPITRAFIENLPLDWKESDCVFDSRVHMLMPGWYPAIPGYHHDDVPRGANGQPNYDNPEYRSEHLMGLVNADICPTKFATGVCVMPKINDGEVIYKRWDYEVKQLIEKGALIEHTAPDRTYIEFDCDAFHTGTEAVANGWRWFGRLSRNTDRVKNRTNEIRKQCQVYLKDPNMGW